MLRQGLIDLYAEKEREIAERIREFAQLRGASEERIFYELCFCIMAAQTSGLKSWKVAELLRANDFFNNGSNPAPFLRQGYIRFHNTKVKQLLEAREKFAEVSRKLKEIKDVKELREWLIQNVKGLGMKEASHFLRNIGRAENLAILDRHILKNMKKYWIVETLPKTLTKKRYLELEEKFIEMAQRLKMKPAELDLLLWAKETGVVFK